MEEALPGADSPPDQGSKATPGRNHRRARTSRWPRSPSSLSTGPLLPRMLLTEGKAAAEPRGPFPVTAMTICDKHRGLKQQKFCSRKSSGSPGAKVKVWDRQFPLEAPGKIRASPCPHPLAPGPFLTVLHPHGYPDLLPPSLVSTLGHPGSKWGLRG